MRKFNSRNTRVPEFKHAPIELMETEEGYAKFIAESISEEHKRTLSPLESLSVAIAKHGSVVAQELQKAGTVMMRIPAGFTAEQTASALEVLLGNVNAQLGTFNGTVNKGVKYFTTKSGSSIHFMVSTAEVEAKNTATAELMRSLLAQAR